MDTQKKCNPLDYELFDNNFDYLTKVVSDEFSETTQEVFFYGKIINTDEWLMNEEYNTNEDSCYVLCPACGKLFQQEEEPETYAWIECPECGQHGMLYDYRDTKLTMRGEFAQSVALVEKFDKGYVLRLFSVGLTYEDRDYDNYETLSHTPDITILEVGREYWCEGSISCYENVNSDIYDAPEFQEVAEIDDSEYYIANYYNDFDPMWSSIVGDNQLGEYDKPYIKVMTKGASYRTFATLQKYGFENLLETYISSPCYYKDSNKITEILGVDYNQVKANWDVETLSVYDLLAARELADYGLSLTKTNIKIMIYLMDRTEKLYNRQNVRKLFKYLRNQISRTSSKSTILAKDYIDYINECRKLGYDLSSVAVLYPSDLPLMHRRTSALLRLDNSPEIKEAVRKAYDKFSSLCEWTDGKLAVIMPSSCDEIIEEGAEQNHCVGGYCERVAKGEDIILFLRKVDKPDKSFYTMEIRPNMKKLDIVQCRGYKNMAVEDAEDVNAFVKKYKRWFNSRKPTANDSLIRKYYKAVKKTSDGRYISGWDNKTEYRVGKVSTETMDTNPDRVAVKGLHIASLEFAKNYGDRWNDVVILEVEVNLNDVIVPDAKDQIRTSKFKVLREVPMDELGEWGEKHSKEDNLHHQKAS